MNKKYIDIILSITTCILWTAFIPFIYYYTYGIAAYYLALPYFIIAAGLTIWWFVRLILLFLQKDKIVYFILAIQIIPILSILFISEDSMEEFDWRYSYDTRMDLISRIESGQLKLKSSWLTVDNFPPISNGGNEISVSRDTSSGKLTMTFYINRGFIDHYSAFVYTTRPEDIKFYEDLINKPYKDRIYEHSENHINKKIADNWYRISE